MRHEKILADVISRAVRFKVDAELTAGPASGIKAGSVVYGLAAFAAASAFSRVVGGRTKPEAPRLVKSQNLVAVDRGSAMSSRRASNLKALVKDAKAAEEYSNFDSSLYEREAEQYEARLEELKLSIATLSLERDTLEERAHESESRCSHLAEKISIASAELQRLEERKQVLSDEEGQLKFQLGKLGAQKLKATAFDDTLEDSNSLRVRLDQLSHEYRRKESGVKYTSATQSSLGNDKKALEVNFQAVCSQLSSARAIGEVTEEVVQLTESKEKLAVQLEELNAELSTYSDLMKLEQADLAQLSKEREEKTAHLKRLESGELETEQKQSAANDQAEVRDLEQRLFEVEELLKLSDLQIAEMDQITASLKTKLIGAEKEIIELQVKLDASLNREEELQHEIERLNAGLSSYREKESNFKARRESDQLEVERLRQRIESLEQQKKSLADELTVYQTGASDLELKFGQAKQQLVESNEREHKLESEIAELQSAIQGLETEKLNLQFGEKQLIETRALMSDVSDERSKIERELELAAQKVEALEREVKDSRATESTLVEGRSTLESSLRARELQIIQSGRELQDAKERESVLSRQVGGLEQTIANLKIESQRWKELKEQLDEDGTAPNTLLDTQERLESQLIEAKGREESARGRIKELDEFSNSVETQNGELRGMLDKLNRECHELREFRAHAEAEKSHASGEVNRLSGSLSDQQTKEEHLAVRITALEAELERRGARILELEESEQKMILQLEQTEEELERAIEVRRATELSLVELKESYSKIAFERDNYSEKSRALELTLVEMREESHGRESQFGDRVAELEHEVEIRDQQLKALLNDTRPSELTEIQPLAVPSSKKRFTKNFDVIPKPAAQKIPPPIEEKAKLAEVPSEHTDVFSTGLDGLQDPMVEKSVDPFVAKKITVDTSHSKPEQKLTNEKSYSPDRSFDSLIEDSKRRKEEQVAHNPEDQWKKEERPAKSDGSGAKWLALIGGGAVVGLGATAAMLWLEMQDQNKPVDQPNESSSASSSTILGNNNPIEPIKAPTNPLFGDEALSKATQSLNTFFGASSIEEKAAVARQPKRTLRHMEVYYAKEPFEDLKVKKIEIIPSEEDLGGGSTGVKAVVNFEGRSKPVTLFLERSSAGTMLLDWETLFRFQRIPWEQYLNIRPQEAIDMHVSVGNGADEHPDISPEEYFGVRVKGWDTEAIRWTTAYIKRDAPGAATFIDKIKGMSKDTDTYGSPAQKAYYILKLRHTGDDNDPTRPLYIEEIVSDTFRYPSDAKAGELESNGDISYDDSSY